MNLKKIRRIYMLGAGGIGMSAIARYFNHFGIQVSGYDKTRTRLTEELQKEGIEIHYSDDASLIPSDIDLVVITPAIRADLGELLELKKRNIPVRKRSEVLGMIAEEKNTIAIAGTHGKTSISTLAALILKETKAGCNAFLGGISLNLGSNLVVSEQSVHLVAEADEFDRSFLTLNPALALISAIDPDHLDVYGDELSLRLAFREFAGTIRPGGKLLLKTGVDIDLSGLSHFSTETYGLEAGAFYYAKNIRQQGSFMHFDLVYPGGFFSDLVLGVPGRFNVENATGAIALALSLGTGEEIIRRVLEGFRGIRRRFEIHIMDGKSVYIDDYAHHPEELNAAIDAARKMFPGKRITGVFQPHLYSRTMHFAGDFARSLDVLDEVYLLDIYPARELPLPGITSAVILDNMANKNSRLVTKDELLGAIRKQRPEVLMTLGAGDIDELVESIVNLLKNDTV